MSGGALDSSVTLEDVFAVVGTKRVPLAPELAGYLMLEVAEHADPNGGDVDPKSVFVSEEGTVALVKPKREGATGDAEASIRAALARLLEASGSQTPALAAASKRRSGAGLPALAEELEAALIPVNRAAGRRALARLAREVKRVTLGVGRNALPSSVFPGAPEPAPPSKRTSARPPPLPPSDPPAFVSASQPPTHRAASAHFTREEEPTTARGQIPDEVMKKATPEPMEAKELPTMQFEPATRSPSPSQADVDALIADFGVSSQGEQQQSRALKAIAGLEPTPPPPPVLQRRIETREVAVGRDSDVEALLGLSALEDKAPVATAVSPPPLSPPIPPPSKSERQLPTQPSKVRQAQASLPSVSTIKPAGRSGFVWVLAALILAAGGFGVWELRGGFPTHATPTAPSLSPSVIVTAPLLCNDIIIVSDVPAHAEVLVRKGQAPVDVERMPVGARLEFVATAEGYAPKRVVVPAGATWDPGSDGKPRYEAALQLDKSRAPHGTNDAWPASEPGSAVGGQGPPGTVHVVATPRGAEVWMLAGLGPDARIEQQLGCSEDVDLLLAGPTTYRKRLHLSAADFGPDDALTGPAAAAANAPGKSPRRVAHASGK
jgi:hypothetical protein